MLNYMIIKRKEILAHMKIEISENSNAVTKKVIGTQVSQELYERLKTESENDFMSISDLLRKIIFLYYREIDKKQNDEKENLN